MTEMAETEKIIINEISSRLMHLWEQRKEDMTKDPIDAETFFDEMEMRAEDIDPIFAHLINYCAVKLYGTLPTANNPFLEI